MLLGLTRAFAGASARAAAAAAGHVLFGVVYIWGLGLSCLGFGVVIFGVQCCITNGSCL